MSCLVFAAFFVLHGTNYTESYPPVPAPPDMANWGLGVQRTMRLLAESTPQRRHRVRILFYGQSITEQEWWKTVVQRLRERFPHADIIAENRAIGGFASQWLIKPAEHDLYPYYPDLLIFHVYGSHTDYEALLRQIRSRTAAEVLLQRDHIGKHWPAADWRSLEKTDKSRWWDGMMNERYLPAFAKKYGCGLVDVRGQWSRYLQQHQLEPQALLKDDIHLNAHGNFVMAEVIGQYLVRRPELPEEPNLVKTWEVGRDISWQQGRLRLEFDGNRVELLPAVDNTAVSEPVTVRIDGEPPSKLPGTCVFRRPRPDPWTSPLTLVRVDTDALLVPEQWTLKVTAYNSQRHTFRFTVTGSVTGMDGEGQSDQPFRSQSGRVLIAPTSWFRNYNELLPVPVGHTIRWEAVALGLDTWMPPQSVDPTRDQGVVVAQGFPPGRHVLELTGPQAIPLRAVRISRPPWQLSSASAEK